MSDNEPLDADAGASKPALSVVLVGRDGYATIRPIITCLAEQTIAAQIEIIAVLPKAQEPGLAPETVAAFHSLVPVVIGTIENRGTAAAKGTAHASADVIAFSENHCFPDPTWAEASLRHYDDPGVAGVAPVVDNGNPETALSWACYATGYATFVSDVTKDVEQMPNHNTTYRASEFHRRANQLEDLLRHEGQFQAAIREEGGRFVMTPEARTKHLNEGTWYLTVGLNYCNGIGYGAKQATVKGWPERIARAAVFPLLTLPIMRNNLARLAATGESPQKGPMFYLGLLAMSAAHAFGEALGYLGYDPKEYPFMEKEVYMVTERLGAGRRLRDERLAGFVALMDGETGR